MDLDAFFEHLWRDYVAMAPRAAELRAVFEARGDTVVNDHVAFRTFDRAPIRVADLEPHLLALGYTPLEPYRFDDKHLNAWAYLPPTAGQPRVFLSELCTEEMPGEVVDIVDALCAQIDPGACTGPDVFWSGRLWAAPTWAQYETLRAHSEYAAWMAALGLRPNHFTIHVNALDSCDTLEDVLRVVEEAGATVSAAGGRIKGSVEVGLEQGSTIADRAEVELADGERHTIPTCYYEFALRHPGPDGTLYQGFVASSADRIFESTDTRAPSAS